MVVYYIYKCFNDIRYKYSLNFNTLILSKIFTEQ